MYSKERQKEKKDLNESNVKMPMGKVFVFQIQGDKERQTAI